MCLGLATRLGLERVEGKTSAIAVLKARRKKKKVLWLEFEEGLKVKEQLCTGSVFVCFFRFR